MIKKILAREKGQGLVEYALILVLVAIVVIVILALLGPAVGNVFSNVVAALEEVGGGNGNVITDVEAGEALGTVTVKVYVSKTVFVSLSGDVSHSGKNCPGSCVFVIPGPAHGTVTAHADGDTLSKGW